MSLYFYNIHAGHFSILLANISKHLTNNPIINNSTSKSIHNRPCNVTRGLLAHLKTKGTINKLYIIPRRHTPHYPIYGALVTGCNPLVNEVLLSLLPASSIRI